MVEREGQMCSLMMVSVNMGCKHTAGGKGWLMLALCMKDHSIGET